MISLSSPIPDLKSLTPQLQKKLTKAGFVTAQDVVFHYPKKYLDFSQFVEIAHLEAGQTVTIRAKIVDIKSKFVFKSKNSHTEAVVKDNTGSLKVIWFNQGYVAKALHKGEAVFLSGKIDYYRGLQLTNPSYELVSSHHLHTGRLVPVYKLPEGVYDKTFRKAVDSLLHSIQDIPDPIPTTLLSKHQLPSLKLATKELHFPSTKQSLAKATERLAYAESLSQQLAVEILRHEREQFASPEVSFNKKLILELVKKLPFSLTTDQKKSLWQILQDLEYKKPMNRLLLGDVGSGKTIVALLASLEVLATGAKTVFLVPTEILAQQHHLNFLKLFKVFGIKPSQLILATSSSKKQGKINKTALELAKIFLQNKGSIIIGTHTLLEDKIKFKGLNLVIIDEQHRFGVKQRSHLLKQIDELDEDRYSIPHLLSMSATPIPRTLALSIYSDLEISYIKEKPAARAQTKTWVIPESKRAGAYQFILEQVKAGRQAFIVAPLVEESETLQSKAVKAEYEKLKNQVFPHLELGLLHGSMKAKEKESVMSAFAKGKFHVLVATSIVEVGIDIPNATVMLIENAERFGLAQLHQLRGRVGRGVHNSFCFVFSEQENEETLARLNHFAMHNNGFELAEYDLKTRGFGTLFGTSQTGFSFKYPEYLTQKVLELAKQDARELVKQDPKLLSHQSLLSQVKPLLENLHVE